MYIYILYHTNTDTNHRLILNHTLSNPVTPSQISLKRPDAAKQLPNKCCSLPGSFVGHAVQNQVDPVHSNTVASDQLEVGLDPTQLADGGGLQQT